MKNKKGRRGYDPLLIGLGIILMMAVFGVGPFDFSEKEEYSEVGNIEDNEQQYTCVPSENELRELCLKYSNPIKTEYIRDSNNNSSKYIGILFFGIILGIGLCLITYPKVYKKWKRKKDRQD